MENIKAGSFVVDYVGEVITSDEAEKRGRKYDAEGRTYLFDLDFNSMEETIYTVDATLFGNLSRFINHSCDPNLNIFSVYINNLDINMPQLAMFAKRNIKRGEQITFDYCGRGREKEETVMDTQIYAKTECRCGAKNCRKVLF